MAVGGTATACGTSCASSLRSGTYGTFIGYQAGMNILDSKYCTFVGANAGYGMVYSNSGIGYDAHNTAIGSYALAAYTGNGNFSGMTAIGSYAMYSQGQNKSDSTAVGYKALYYGGGSNTCVGAQSFSLATNTGNNAILGNAVGGALTSGSVQTNVFVGVAALQNATTGDVQKNVMVGFQSGAQMTTGNIQSNTFIGYQSGYSYAAAAVPTYCICIGAGASGTATEDHTTRIGQLSGGDVQTKFYASGIYGITPGGTKNIALVDSNHQLGSTATLAQSYLVNGLTWNNSTSTPVTAAVNNEYTINTASGLTTINLPATAAVNDRIKIVGSGVDGWTLVASSGDTIQMGSTPTSSGGSISSTVRYDCVEIVCIVANTTWVVSSSQGTLTVA